MMNISIGYGEVTFGIVVILVIQFLVANWLKARIEGAIKAEYDRQLTNYKHELDKKLEDYRNDIRIREQAARVAGLLARIRWPKDLKEQEKMREAGEEFDRLAWELSLWLPSEIYVKLAQCLVEKRDLKSVKQLLIEVRKLLLANQADGLVADNILHFGKPEEAK